MLPTNFQATGNSILSGSQLPADAQTLLNNIPDGGRWIFALAQATPVGRLTTTVDGGDLTWGFEIPEATVTRTPAAATLPTTPLTAADLDWGFEIPEATVTIVRAAGFDHEIDGGNLSPGASPSRRPPLRWCGAAGPVDHAVDGGSLSWGFYLPRARVAHSGTAEYTLEVDWDNDGTYANANADVWGRVIEGTFRCRRGATSPANARGEVSPVRWKCS